MNVVPLVFRVNAAWATDSTGEAFPLSDFGEGRPVGSDQLQNVSRTPCAICHRVGLAVEGWFEAESRAQRFACDLFVTDMQ